MVAEKSILNYNLRRNIIHDTGNLILYNCHFIENIRKVNLQKYFKFDTQKILKSHIIYIAGIRNNALIKQNFTVE